MAKIILKTGLIDTKLQGKKSRHAMTAFGSLNVNKSGRKTEGRLHVGFVTLQRENTIEYRSRAAIIEVGRRISFPYGY